MESEFRETAGGGVVVTGFGKTVGGDVLATLWWTLGWEGWLH